MEINREYVNLVRLMTRYDPYMETKRTRDFNHKIYRDEFEMVVPLDKDETTIYRYLINSSSKKPVKEIAKLMKKSEFYVKKRIVVIRKTLELYFNDVFKNAPNYPAEVNDSNYEATIFGFGLSYKGICELRLWKCYYLRDVSCLNFEFIREFLSAKDYEILVNRMKEVGLPIDWYQRREKLVICNPHNCVFY